MNVGVSRQLDGCPKGLDQRVPDEVLYDSMDHLIGVFVEYSLCEPRM